MNIANRSMILRSMIVLWALSALVVSPSSFAEKNKWLKNLTRNVQDAVGGNEERKERKSRDESDEEQAANLLMNVLGANGRNKVNSGDEIPASPLEALAKRDVVNSALVGAVSGAVIGGIIANNSGDGDDEEKGMIIGAIAGGLIGGSVGKVAAKRRKHFASESEYLEKEIEIANNVIDTKTQQIASAKTQALEAKQEYARLKEQAQRNADITEQKNAELERLSAVIAQQNEQLEAYEQSIEYLNVTLAESLAMRSETAQERMEQEALQMQLVSKRNKVSEQFATLAEVRDINSGVYASLQSL